LKVLKLTFIKQRMLAVLITLTPGHPNEFIDCQKGKVRIAVFPIMNVKTRWYSTLELLERAYRLRELTREWLQNPKYAEHRPLFTTQDEWTIVKYVMEVLRPFRYWTLWMSQRHTVTLRHVITVYNDMFDHMDGVMRALAKNKTPLKEDLFFAVKLARQKLSKYYAEVIQRRACFGCLRTSLILLGSCDRFESGTMEWILILRTRHPTLHNTKVPF
jgi:hypothetical protein